MEVEYTHCSVFIHRFDCPNDSLVGASERIGRYVLLQGEAGDQTAISPQGANVCATPRGRMKEGKSVWSLGHMNRIVRTVNRCYREKPYRPNSSQ